MIRSDATPPTEGLEQIIARMALEYDLLPYTSNPFPQTQPGRLGAIVRLSGLEAAPLASARVLELGCAGGGNLIPLAARFPGARFVGVDLSRTQVAEGRARIGRLGLANVEILCRSFTELDADDGAFDYIVCHGVYSWAPAPVREAILRICRERLSPQGVAYVSYNVLPGWRMMQGLRDSLMLHVAETRDLRQRVAQSRELLASLAEASPEGTLHKQALTAWHDRFQQFSDDYIAHEFLEEVNDPCLFRDFVAAAERAGLAFLAEAELPSMIVENYPPQTAEQARRLGGGQLLAIEQYLDMLTGRTFRQSLLIARERFDRVRRDINPDAMEGLAFLTRGDLRIEREGEGGRVIDAAGRTLSTMSPAVLDCLERLIARFPASSTLDDLLPDAGCADAAERRALARDALLKMTLVGMAIVTIDAIDAAAAPGPRPKGWAIAADDAARGEQVSTNLRHERVALDAVAQALLPKLDGSATAADLAAHLVRLGKEGRLNFAEHGAPVSDDDAMSRIAEEQTAACLQYLAKAALLTA
ncbi:methyltransferase regulatory domain-containing protein [Methylocapsa aurea]|jgi:SAM-dependent methyltransferase|uniref:methyltransferase regulatory domain-containing protein n=1 Tax=Methylocapsa aurea TaxID=663610 RepID=UPI003D18C7B3